MSGHEQCGRESDTKEEQNNATFTSNRAHITFFKSFISRHTGPRGQFFPVCDQVCAISSKKVPLSTHAARNRALKNVRRARVSGERGVVLFLPAFDGSFVVEVKLLLLLLLFSGQSVQRERREDGVKGESGGRLIYTRPAPGRTASFITGFKWAKKSPPLQR